MHIEIQSIFLDIISRDIIPSFGECMVLTAVFNYEFFDFGGETLRRAVER